VRRAVLALVLAILLVAAPPARAQQAEDDPLLASAAQCRASDDHLAHHRTQRLAMHCLIRVVRRRAGLPALRSHDALRHSATYKARRIAACRVFTHAPCGDELSAPFVQARLTRHGAWRVGENLGWGVDADASARVVLRRWLASPSHRDVLLDRSFTHLGVRRRRLRMQGAPPGAVLWVVHLGRRAPR
jgi:uncharacterized protein YkwD